MLMLVRVKENGVSDRDRPGEQGGNESVGWRRGGLGEGLWARVVCEWKRTWPCSRRL